MKFSHTFRIKPVEIDGHDHVNNVVYLRWIQDVAIAHWQSTATIEEQEKFTWFVLRHEIDYRNRAFEGEEVTAETWVGKATRIKCERFTEIRRNGEILVKAKSIWCLLDLETGKPAKITEGLRSVFGMLQ